MIQNICLLTIYKVSAEGQSFLNLSAVLRNWFITRILISFYFAKTRWCALDSACTDNTHTHVHTYFVLSIFKRVPTQSQSSAASSLLLLPPPASCGGSGAADRCRSTAAVEGVINISSVDWLFATPPWIIGRTERNLRVSPSSIYLEKSETWTSNFACAMCACVCTCWGIFHSDTQEPNAALARSALLPLFPVIISGG